MFQVKATVVGFLGDEKRYPCHFQHKVGDEFIFDGEKFVGRICPHMVPMLIPRMMELYGAGPRMVSAGYYFPFWYSPLSVKDPSLKKYDGVGFKNVLKTIVEPPHHMARLEPAEAFNWPPHKERTIARDASVVCGDHRTSMVMKIAALDLSDKGESIPYFRRQMSILSKVLPKPGIEVDKILNEFSKEQIERIYPALSQIMIQVLSEELALMSYLEIKDGKASVTKKGEAKLEDFKKSLSAEEREALQI